MTTTITTTHVVRLTVTIESMPGVRPERPANVTAQRRLRRQALLNGWLDGVRIGREAGEIMARQLENH